MIYVKKPLSKRPNKWQQAALEETRMAIAHFRNPQARKKDFQFKAYKHPELKAALQ